jgi:hypothetical protein
LPSFRDEEDKFDDILTPADDGQRLGASSDSEAAAAAGIGTEGAEGETERARIFEFGKSYSFQGILNELSTVF